MRIATRMTVVAILLASPLHEALAQSLSTNLTLLDSEAEDQDDMCIWLHPKDSAKSTIIASDKDGAKLFVYDLTGNTLQVVATDGKPGNIDLRYNFNLAGERLDLVGFNDRDNKLIAIYSVDPETRQLTRVDDGSIATASNYGFCMYRSSQTGQFYAFKTFKSSRAGTIAQFELRAEGDRITGEKVREFELGSTTEGCVCDDETGMAYFAEEDVGIWKIGAEPEAGTAPELIAEVGDSTGLTADVEGLAIYYAAEGSGYLIASSQGAGKFTVLDRRPPHAYRGEFTIDNVKSTDGIDVMSIYLNDNFSQGIFTYHIGTKSPHGVGVISWEDIADFAGELIIDYEYWDPRRENNPTGVHRDLNNSPASFGLRQNYPNPFRSSSSGTQLASTSTTISFVLERASEVKLTIMSLLGQSIRTLVTTNLAAGEHRVHWDGRDYLGQKVSDGIYLYRLENDDRIETRKLTLLK